MLDVRVDCRHYRGDRPCKPHKRDMAIHCEDCSFYDRMKERILIIKLGAAGDVIRTTPLLRRLRADMPHAHITWVSYWPELVPSLVERKMRMDGIVFPWISHLNFDIAYCLDKDPEAIALAEIVNAREKHGYSMDEFGNCRPFNSKAEGSYVRGIWDDLSQENRKSYPQEIFEICGYEFKGEKYILDKSLERTWDIRHDVPVVGLNTGVGARWSSRLWPDEHWTTLAVNLRNEDYDVLWLGGKQEDERNRKLAEQAGGRYEGYFSLAEFIDLVDQCDVVVTQVTMALHIALALEKRVVLMNTIFNRYEFEMYSLGEIVEPPEPCSCFYATECPHDSMRKITPEVITSALMRQMKNRL